MLTLVLELGAYKRLVGCQLREKRLLTEEPITL